MHESLVPWLKEIGIDANYQPSFTRQEIKSTISNYDGLIIRSKTFVDQELIAQARNLKFVARAGSGIDNLDVDYLKLRNIAIINAPEGNRDAVGEHTIGLILNLLHNIHQGHEQVIENVWNRESNRGAELSTKTVGIIGYGHMGRAFAKKLAAFGCKVIAYDKYHPGFKTGYAKSVSLKQLKEETDILSLHVPLTPETLAMTKGDFFSEFKKNILFINTSRGEIAPLNSIVKAMQSGKIVKAGLDVLENEKLKTLHKTQKINLAYLKESGRVIFTPHVAGWSTESYIRINKVLIKKIKSLF